MKQKQIQVIFYFLFSIMLSFSSHAKTTATSVFPTDSLPASGQAVGLSHDPGHPSGIYKSPRKKPKCPRKTVYDDDKHEAGCFEAHRQCVETCCHKIKRGTGRTESAERQRDCYVRCDANYAACIRG